MSNALDLARTQYAPKTGKTYQRSRVGAIIPKRSPRIVTIAGWPTKMLMVGSGDQ